MKVKKEKELKPTKNATPLKYIGLVESDADEFKKVLEEKIALLNAELEKIMPGFKEAEQMYLEYKGQVDNSEGKINSYKNILLNLSNLQRKAPVDTATRIMRTTSHTEQKEFRKISTGDWKQYLKSYLERKRMFIDIRQAYDTLKKQHSIGAVPGSYFSEFMKMIMQEHKLIVKHGEIKRDNVGFVVFQNKVGLFSWVDKNLRPKPEFLSNLINNNHHATVS